MKKASPPHTIINHGCDEWETVRGEVRPVGEVLSIVNAVLQTVAVIVFAVTINNVVKSQSKINLEGKLDISVASLSFKIEKN